MVNTNRNASQSSKRTSFCFFLAYLLSYLFAQTENWPLKTLDSAEQENAAINGLPKGTWYAEKAAGNNPDKINDKAIDQRLNTINYCNTIICLNLLKLLARILSTLCPKYSENGIVDEVITTSVLRNDMLMYRKEFYCFFSKVETRDDSYKNYKKYI